jgi:hypothetical protein
VTNPQAGVWEVSVDARRNSDNMAGANFTLTASILGASVSPNPDVIASATVGVPVRSELHAHEPVRCVHRTGGRNRTRSARIATPTIAHLAQQTTDTTIPAGATSFRATIGSPSDPAADLDLFVFNCTSGTCVLAGQSADGTPRSR